MVLLSVIALLRRRSGRPLCGDTGALGLQNEGQAALDAVPSGTNRRERGAMLIEAAVVFPVLLITSLLAIELLWVSYVALTTQFTAARVLRQASVGPEVFAVPPHTASATPFESYITQSFLEISQELLVSIQPEQISIECVPAVRCPTTAGIPGATVKLEVNRPTRVLFWGSIVVQGIAMGRNERWRS
ncbi:MAG: hypothetical protein KDD69_08455 [Bdellovibrionales bacterium]|nr:hypothetical protein [Bdellovibrionales bacterium]